MIDLLQATEFIKIGKNRYMNKLSNGIIYSEEELKELLRKNNRELNKVVKEETNEVKPETTQTTKRYNRKKHTRN